MLYFFISFILVLVALAPQVSISCDIAVINPVVGAAMVSGGASILNGIGNALGIGSSNNAQIKIAKENRDWQTKERLASEQWQEKMFHMTNEYNSPAAERKRYEEAGLNPFINGNNLGSGASMPSVPSMPSAPNMPNIQPVNYLQGVPNAVQSFLMARQQTADYDKTRQEILASRMELLQNAFEKGGKDLAEWTMKQFPVMEGNFNRASRAGEQYFQSKINALDAQSRYNNANALFREQLNNSGEADRIIAKYDNEFMELHARIGKMASDVSVNEAEIKELLSRVVSNFSKAAESDANAKTINQSRQFIITKLQALADMIGYERDSAEADWQENEYVRKAKRSKLGKGNKVVSYAATENAVVKTIDKIKGIKIQTNNVSNTTDSHTTVYSSGNVRNTTINTE